MIGAIVLALLLQDDVLEKLSRQPTWMQKLQALTELNDPDLPGAARDSVARDLLSFGDRRDMVVELIRRRLKCGARVLESLLDDPDANLRALAVEGLGLLGVPEMEREFESRLKDPSEAVRIAAASSLICSWIRQVPVGRAHVELERAGWHVRRVEVAVRRILDAGIEGLGGLLEALGDQPLPDSTRIDEALKLAARGLGRSASVDETKRAIAAIFSLGPAVKPQLQALATDVEGVRFWIDRLVPIWERRWFQDCECVLMQEMGKIQDPDKIDFMVRRALKLLERTRRHEDLTKLHSILFVSIGRAADDRALIPLLAALDHPDPEVAAWVVETFGGQGSVRYAAPNFMLRSRESERPAVLRAAFRRTSGVDSLAYLEKLRKIFSGGDENLKFQACFNLMHDFGDADAVQYLIDQIASENRERSDCALGWLGDSSNRQKDPPKRLMDEVRPRLKSPDAQARRRAVDALRPYKGEVILRALVPMLSDPVEIIRTTVEHRLLEEWDRDRVRRVLSESDSEAARQILKRVK